MSFGFTVKRYKASSRQGLGRICSVCSALGLEPAFRRGLGLGVGFKVQVKVNQKKEHVLRYREYALRRACV